VKKRRRFGCIAGGRGPGFSEADASNARRYVHNTARRTGTTSRRPTLDTAGRRNQGRELRRDGLSLHRARTRRAKQIAGPAAMIAPERNRTAVSVPAPRSSAVLIFSFDRSRDELCRRRPLDFAANLAREAHRVLERRVAGVVHRSFERDANSPTLGTRCQSCGVSEERSCPSTGMMTLSSRARLFAQSISRRAVTSGRMLPLFANSSSITASMI